MPPKTPSSAAPSGRLDSLNRRGASTAATRGRFAPKVVARRSKEERDKTAPAEKPVVEDTKPFDRGSDRGGGRGGRGGGRGGMDRGRGRGGRGGGGPGGGRGGRFQPVAVAAMGPFAAPGSVQDTSRRVAPAFEMREGTPSYNPAQLRIKSETPGVGSSGENTPAPEDENRIDMTSNIPIDGELAAFFPIRLDRREEDLDAEEQIPLPEPQVARERPVDDVKIKDEPMEDGGFPQEPAVKSETMERYLSIHERKELDRIQRDYQQITEEFNIKASLSEDKAKALEQRLYFFQMPAVLPEFSLPEENNEKQKVEGMAGHLRLHQSGKLTMVLGDIVMEVTQGTESNFLQDVVVMDHPEKKAYLVGQVSRKMIVSPDITRLLA